MIFEGLSVQMTPRRPAGQDNDLMKLTLLKCNLPSGHPKMFVMNSKNVNLRQKDIRILFLILMILYMFMGEI